MSPFSSLDDSSWEPDGVTTKVRFCEEPGTNLCMKEAATANTNVCLTSGENPAYSPSPLPKRTRGSSGFLVPSSSVCRT
jgi:hypothetical protein